MRTIYINSNQSKTKSVSAFGPGEVESEVVEAFLEMVVAVDRLVELFLDNLEGADIDSDFIP